MRRTPRPAEPVTRLEVVEKRDEDLYDYEYKAVCMACDPIDGREIAMTPAMQAVVDGIQRATSSARRDEVQAWEEDIRPCKHTQTLTQEAVQPPALGSEASCSQCALTSNLWMCLQCGHLGCGRAQFGGIEGHSHALAHFEATGHPCSVKQGTITPEGAGDVYCYACNDAVVDPALGAHLQHFGVPVATLSKTEKSMTELQLEQNVQFDFNMVDSDGQELVPAYGPGNTGIQNLGNSCYLASTLQALFGLPVFQERFRDLPAHVATCTRPPTECLECQMRKVADGLESGRYAVGERPLGIKPAMIKALLGRGHSEFASMRQQDAEEFFQHLVSSLRRLPEANNDPTQSFSYVLEHKLQCTRCGRVRYSEEAIEAGVGLPVPVHKNQDAFEPVSLRQSLDLFTAPESIQYECPACACAVEATKQTRFATLPETLVVQAQRFQLINWVPQKVNVPFTVPLSDTVDLAPYLGRGLQPGEETFPEADEKPAFDPDAVAMLTGLGFSEPRAQRALQATNGDVEASANWLFERVDDASLDTPLTQSPSVDTSALEDMGFTRAQAAKALRLHGQVEVAVAWLFENPDDPGDTEPPATPARAGLTEAPARYRLASFITHRGVRASSLTQPSVHSGHVCPQQVSLAVRCACAPRGYMDLLQVRERTTDAATKKCVRVTHAGCPCSGPRRAERYGPSSDGLLILLAAYLAVTPTRGGYARSRPAGAPGSQGSDATCPRSYSRRYSKRHSPSTTHRHFGSAPHHRAGMHCARASQVSRHRRTFHPWADPPVFVRARAALGMLTADDTARPGDWAEGQQAARSAWPSHCRHRRRVDADYWGCTTIRGT